MLRIIVKKIKLKYNSKLRNKKINVIFFVNYKIKKKRKVCSYVVINDFYVNITIKGRLK